ncbi:amidohydrolase [Arthrobacter sulfonylureivorans]|uniref:amidohydrolase n=1 Tax=Arthrobacter sulfonylureivorans TaxID=2486855 RepID=UPI0039E4D2F5
MAAGWIFHSGRIFDGLRLHPSATAVAVRDGLVTAVGTDAEVRAAAGLHATAVDLNGRLLAPGFTDAHVHAVMAGLERLGCDLSQCVGADAVLAQIATSASAASGASAAGSGWITGGGWHKADFPGGYPTRQVLDAVVPDRPAYLVNADHHSAWVNSKALELAGIDASTPDPADGLLEREADGFPSGTLHEGAMDLVNRAIPRASVEDMRAGLLEAQRYLHSVGVTGWQEAILGDYAGYPEASAAYRRLLDQGLLTGRAAGALWVPRSTTVESVLDLVAEFITRREQNAAAGFRTTSAKIMVDGVPENRTAAMLEPYLTSCACEGMAGHDGGASAGADRPLGGGPGDGDRHGSPAGRGLTYLSKEVLRAVTAALDAAGFDLHLHVIGDRAVRDGLDAVAHARRANGRGAGRHHMAHLQIIHPADVPRFGELDVTANLQALWACNDAQMRELTVPLIGAERAGWQYPFRSLAASGARLAMGSDWPVSSPDPWQAIHVAVNRSHPDDGSDSPLLPDEALTLEAALAAYTSGSAWLNRHDGGGRIGPGAPADLVVLDINPFSLPAAELHTVGTDLTFVAGEPVFERQAVRA